MTGGKEWLGECGDGSSVDRREEKETKGQFTEEEEEETRRLPDLLKRR